MDARLRHPIAVFKERPFDGRVRRVQITQRISIAEIAAGIDDMPAGWFKRCECRINGELVPRGLWHLIRIKPEPGRDIVVSFTVPIHGGPSGAGGQRKNTGAMVASIAVLLAALAVSGGALGPAYLGWGGAAFAAGELGAVAAGGAIGVGGPLEANALKGVQK